MKRVVLFFLFFLLLFPKIGFAQKASPSAIANPPNVEYFLPYPGILPDNPLYFLKAFRDNFVGFFISDLLKKADYDLLMADKRLVSATALIDKKNYDLGITTLSKSENYFEQAVGLIQKAKEQGKDVNSLIDKLILASQKHQREIYLMEKKTNGARKDILELSQVRAKNFEDILSVVKSQ